VYSLALREWKRFLRQRNRVFGALAQPILFWLIFGSGMSASFVPAGSGAAVTYGEYFFAGTVVLVLLFTAIFSSISIIDDRNEGFLQAVLVAPIPASSIVLGKVLGTTALAVAQGLMLFCLAPIAGVELTVGSVMLCLPVLVVIAFGLAALGFLIAWRTDSTQGFHAVMSAFLMPMWLLSGSFFPAAGLPAWLGAIVALNPLTYGVAAFRRILYSKEASAAGDVPSLTVSLVVITTFAVLTCAVAIRAARNRAPGTSAP
jgi:ABC-2 type transport system permease protein